MHRYVSAEPFNHNMYSDECCSLALPKEKPLSNFSVNPVVLYKHVWGGTCQGTAQRTSAGGTSMRLVGDAPLSAALCTWAKPGALSFMMHWLVRITAWSCTPHSLVEQLISWFPCVSGIICCS